MASEIPNSWMPNAAMSRIHVHWTAGGHKANDTDRGAYHVLIEGDGNLVRGNKSIAANARGSGLSPASHTLNANTGAIGVSMCAMASAKESPFESGRFPLTKAQWDTMVKVVARLAAKYVIPVTRETILTHAEVHPTLGIKQRSKWDITRLSFDPSVVGHYPVGDRMRREVATALDSIRPSSGSSTPPADARLPRFRVMGVAPSTLNLRRTPGGEKIGELPEGARVERLAMSAELVAGAHRRRLRRLGLRGLPRSRGIAAVRASGRQRGRSRANLHRPLPPCVWRPLGGGLTTTTFATIDGPARV